MSITPIARQALEDVALWLEAGAPHVVKGDRVVDHFNMEYPVSQGGPECGTTCCIAGAIVQFNGLGMIDDPEFGASFHWSNVKKLAMDHLELYYGKATSLFEPWVEFEGQEYSFSNPLRAAAVVRHYLATEVIDWDMFPDSMFE